MLKGYLVNTLSNRLDVLLDTFRAFSVFRGKWFTDCSHAIALNNGRVALALALYALDIGAGDEVITTCRSFTASASC